MLKVVQMAWAQVISGREEYKRSQVLDNRITDFKYKTLKSLYSRADMAQGLQARCQKVGFEYQDADRCAAEQVSVEAVPGKDERESNQGLEPVPDVYALGDCCANVEAPLPALAQARHARQRSRRSCN